MSQQYDQRTGHRQPFWSSEPVDSIEFNEEHCEDVEHGDEKQYLLPERQHAKQYDGDDKHRKYRKKSRKKIFPYLIIALVIFLLLGGLCLIWLLKSSGSDFKHDVDHNDDHHHGNGGNGGGGRGYKYRKNPHGDKGHGYPPKDDKGNGNVDDDDNGPIDDREVLFYDYVTVGQGIGGVATNYWLSEALRRIGVAPERVSIAAFEAADDIGGNIVSIVLEKPPNYDGSFGRELLGDQGAQRTAQMTLGMKRRLIHQFGIEMLWSPFQGDYSTRGHRLVCIDPTVNAFNDNATYDRSPDADGLFDMAFAYGSLCLPDEFFVGNVSTQFDRPFPNLHNPDVGNNGDPTENGYLWLLEGAKFEVARVEPDLDTGNYDFIGFGSENPVTGEQCVNASEPGFVQCPFDLAKTNHLEWKTHVAETFRFDTEENDRATKHYNYDYADYLEIDNVGFMGDYREQFAAYSYGEWQLREWGGTNNIFGYLPGGERRLLTALFRGAERNGVDLFLNERILKFEYSDKRGYEFKLETSKNRTVYVREFLFMNMHPYDLFPEDENEDGTRWPGADVEGEIVKDLREVPEVQAPIAADVLRVLAQWEPGKRAWFWDLYDFKTGNKSYRQLGDRGCFSRTEFIDTPYHRCTNHIVPVYTDDECERVWLSYLTEFKRTGDTTKLKKRVVDEMKASFPELAFKIDEPVLVNVTHFKHAWHWVKRTHSKISNTDVLIKTAAPLGDQVPLALVGEAYGLNWAAWVEGALRSSKRALLTRFRGSLNETLHEIFDELFQIFPETDGSVSDASPLSNFAYIPPLFEDPDPDFVLDTEKWWPYGPYDTFNENRGDYCRAARHGLTPFDE